MKRTLLIILGILILPAAFAQEAAKQYSLQECVDIALEKNLGVKRSLYNMETFRINLLQSKAAFLPTLNGFSSYNKNYGRGLNPVTNLYSNRNSTNIQVGANSSLMLFNGLRLQYALRASQRDVEASGKDFEKAKNDVIINVVTLYTNVIFNKELYENAKLQLNTSEQQLEVIKKQVLAGSLPKSSELNQEATVATNEMNLINQENVLNLSLLQLKQSMQLPSSTALDVVAPDLAAEDLVLEQTPDEIYAISLESMPEIKSALLKVESAQMALRANKGNFYPRLTLNANATSNYSSLSDNQRTEIDETGTPTLSTNPLGMAVVPGFPNVPVYGILPPTRVVASDYNEMEQLMDNLFRGFTFKLNIPVFNGLQTRSAVQRAAVQSEIALINKMETENTLRQTIESAFNDAQAASKSYNASLKQVNAREEAFRMNKQRFDIGALSQLEYQTSENDLFRAKSDLSRAKYNFIFKKKLLDFYQGKTITY